MGRFLSIDSWTGDFLAERGLVTPQQLNEASELAVRWGANLADVMLTKNWIAEDEYYTALAERFSVELVDLQASPGKSIFSAAQSPRRLEAVPQ